MLTPTAPTPKDHSTAHVIRDTQEMECSAKVSLVNNNNNNNNNNIYTGGVLTLSGFRNGPVKNSNKYFWLDVVR